MPTFDTPTPIDIVLHIEMGGIRIVAVDRAETVVEIYPSTKDNKADIRAAQQTRVEYEDGNLVVKAPKGLGLLGSPGSVSMEISVPRGSRLTGTAEKGDVTCEGPFGDCTLNVDAGDIRIDRAGAVRLRTHYGNITLGEATGTAEVTTGSGEVRIQRIDGDAEIKNSNGNRWVDEITGDLRLRVANGDINIGRAHASVTSKSATGSIRVEEVSSGAVELHTKTGDLEVGIREGTAAWLDVTSRSGTVHSSLDAAEEPGEGAETVEVRARTSIGDIVIRRAHSA